LDTTFQRVDDGRVLWINLDLPDVASLRLKLIPDSDRERTVAKSVFDFTWIDEIAPQTGERPVMFMAAGVLCYFTPQEVETLFCRLAADYASAHVIFDAMSQFVVWGTNRKLLKESGMDSSAILKWHLNKASHLRRWVDTLHIIEEFSILSRVPVRKGLSRREIWGMKLAGPLRLYNMVHVQL
jgi:O-methyltransferase involved in polyketide biosynthesis